jgi:hypothetical protein
VGILDDLLGKGDVLLEGELRPIDHNRGKTAVHARFAYLEILAVVEVDADRQSGVLDSGLDQLHEVNVFGIFAGARRHLED